MPKNGSLFFTIFQTFMASAGSATEDPATTTSVSELPEVAEPNERVGGYMYILGCGDGSFYTGSTTDLHLRLEQHRNGEGAQHTKARLPVKLLYY